jgi:hypothetical protein
VDTNLFSRFAPLLRDLTGLELAYFPVGQLNVAVHIVIVRLTPGRQQMQMR